MGPRTASTGGAGADPFGGAVVDPAPRFPDAATRDRVRELLAVAGYRDDTVREALGGSAGAAPPATLLGDLPAGINPVLALLIRLFRVGQDHTIDETVDALGEHVVEALASAGLVRLASGKIRPTAQLLTMDDLVIAADLPARHAEKAHDFVLGPFGVTKRLADFTIRRHVGSALDLGCGSGTLGALATVHADRVVATDINERAVAFATFNADLNGLEHMECRVGDLFEPVDGERFDLIVCNPPYVISPTDTYAYRDGGTVVCREIVSRAAEHLNPGGHLQMLVEWPQRAGSDWRAEVDDWLEDVPCDAWLLRVYSLEAREYADVWLGQEYRGGEPPPEARAAWLEHLERLRVASVGGGLLILRKADRAMPIRTLRDAPKMTLGPIGDSLERWLSSQSLLASIEHAASLLDVVLEPAPTLASTERKIPTGEGWKPDAHELRIRKGLLFGAVIDPVAEEIVGLLDGRRTAREALTAFADRRGISAAPFVEGLPKALARLLDLGLLVPAEGG